MIRSIGQLGPSQIETCRAQWPAFRDLEARTVAARQGSIASYDAAKRPGLRLALRRLDLIERQVALAKVA